MNDSYKVYLIYQYFFYNEVKYIDAVTNIERTCRGTHRTHEDLYRLIQAEIERETFNRIMREVFSLLRNNYFE